MIRSPARGAIRAIRVGLLGTTSMTLATTAHLMGGGPLPPVSILIVSGLLVGLVAVTATARRCRLRRPGRAARGRAGVAALVVHRRCRDGRLPRGRRSPPGTTAERSVRWAVLRGRATEWVVRPWEWPHRRCGWPTRSRCSRRPGCWRVAKPGCGGWRIGSSAQRRQHRPAGRLGAARCGIRPSGCSICRRPRCHRPPHGVRLSSRRSSSRRPGVVSANSFDLGRRCPS